MQISCSQRHMGVDEYSWPPAMTMGNKDPFREWDIFQLFLVVSPPIPFSSDLSVNPRDFTTTLIQGETWVYL